MIWNVHLDLLGKLKNKYNIKIEIIYFFLIQHWIIEHVHIFEQLHFMHFLIN